MMSYGHMLVWVSCSSCVSSQFPQHPCQHGNTKNQRSPWPCASPVQKWQTPLYYQHCSQHKSNIQPHTSHCEENQLSQNHRIILLVLFLKLKTRWVKCENLDESFLKSAPYLCVGVDVCIYTHI